MNGLRIDNKPGEETRCSVRAVLDFMSVALSAIYSDGDYVAPDILLGAARVLEVCAEALEEVDGEGGAR